jgi:hypothetical protein
VPILRIIYGQTNSVRPEREIFSIPWQNYVRGEANRGFWWGKPEGKRPLGRPRRRWDDNIKMDLQEVGCGGMDWIELAQDRDR